MEADGIIGAKTDNMKTADCVRLAGQENPFRDEMVAGEATRDRYDRTLAFCAPFLTGGTMLDIGPPNDLGRAVTERLNTAYRYTGEEDLDTIGSLPRADHILIFEVLEHLFNPLHLLLKAKEALNSGGRVYITVPRRPCWLWNDKHFHEFDAYRFGALLKRAGFRVAAHTKWRIKQRKFGVRPVIRFFVEFYHAYVLEKMD